MFVASVFFLRKGGSPRQDDTMTIRRVDGYQGVFQVTYTSPDFTFGKTFTSHGSSVCNYIEDSLKSMRHDTEPFESIQVSTVVHPSVMYHTSDMDDADVRELILDMIRDAMRFDVTSSSR